jgi:hypothetical protein
MIFDVNRESLVLGIEARAFGNGPTHQNAIQLQSKIVVQAAGRMLLDKIQPTGSFSS